MDVYLITENNTAPLYILRAYDVHASNNYYFSLEFYIINHASKTY